MLKVGLDSGTNKTTSTSASVTVDVTVKINEVGLNIIAGVTVAIVMA